MAWQGASLGPSERLWSMPWVSSRGALTCRRLVKPPPVMTDEPLRRVPFGHLAQGARLSEPGTAHVPSRRHLCKDKESNS